MTQLSLAKNGKSNLCASRRVWGVRYLRNSNELTILATAPLKLNATLHDTNHLSRLFRLQISLSH